MTRSNGGAWWSRTSSDSRSHIERCVVLVRALDTLAILATLERCSSMTVGASIIATCGDDGSWPDRPFAGGAELAISISRTSLVHHKYCTLRSPRARQASRCHFGPPTAPAPRCTNRPTTGREVVGHCVDVSRVKTRARARVREIYRSHLLGWGWGGCCQTPPSDLFADPPFSPTW